MSEVLLDVNLLIASVIRNHVDHARAQAFIASVSHFYTTPTTQGGFLRFLTRPWKDQQKQEQPPRMTIAEAMAALRDVAASAKHVFLADDEPFSGISLRSISGHRQWTDAYLLRLSRKHAIRLATLDRKLENMDDPASPTLLIVS